MGFIDGEHVAVGPQADRRNELVGIHRCQQLRRSRFEIEGVQLAVREGDVAFVARRGRFCLEAPGDHH
jgi:hypothetical protein